MQHRFLIVIVLALGLSSLVVAQDRVLVGQSPGGVRAWLSAEQGLVVEGWSGGTLRLGRGCEPRFDAAGNLYFRRTTDDGEHLLSSANWFVKKGQHRARLLAQNEWAPSYVLPPVAPGPAAAAVKVCVDAGHGGTDGGATGNGLLEKNINFDIAKRLQALLDLDTKDTRGGGTWSVLMTRKSDVFISLAARVNMANAFAAASFISVHNNAASATSATGSETYCYRGLETKTAGSLRNRLHKELIAAWKLRDRGVKTAGFYVIRYTRMPAALIEGGFITNASDAKTLASATARQRLALGLLWAIQEHHGFKRYTPSGTGSTNGVLRGVVYDASKGTGTRIVDATVSLSNGVFVRSSSSGSFSFSLKPGAYRYAATAPGFESAEVVRTVVSGKDVWGSVGLRRGNVPSLTIPGAPIAGSNLTGTLRGDGRSPAWLMIGARPRLPRLSLSNFGRLWPSTVGALVLPIGPMPSSGTLRITRRTPTIKGLRVHLQALVRSAGAWRLSNGAGVQLR